MASPSRKHKRHKSDRRESQTSVDGTSLGGGLKLILKVGSQTTPEHLADYSEDITEDRDRDHSHHHHHHHHHHRKKSKKKKKKRDKKERKHHHHHRHHHHHHSHNDQQSVEVVQEQQPPPLSVCIDEKTDRKRKREETDEADEDSAGGGSGPMSGHSTGSSTAAHREPRSCVLRKIQERTVVQKMLDQLLLLLEKKDPQQFFAWPVTDNIAPGYSAIISRPMDFSTMRQKIEDNLYATLPEFMEDFKLMCDNAMLYNHVDTVYYKASKKLLHASMKMTHPEKMGWVLHQWPELGPDVLGFEVTAEMRYSAAQRSPHIHGSAHSSAGMAGRGGSTPRDDHDSDTQNSLQLAPTTTSTSTMSIPTTTITTATMTTKLTLPVSQGKQQQQQPSAANTITTPTLINGEVVKPIKDPEPDSIASVAPPTSKFESYSDNLTPEEILSKAQIAAREARAKLLHKQRCNSACNIMGYLKQRKDGGTTLNVVVGGEGLVPGTRKRPVLLGQLCGEVPDTGAGTGQLAGYREDRRNAGKPVRPLCYGAFGSYAPTYDSAFANLSKHESDLVFQTYGSDAAVQYAESILDFVRDNDYCTQLVDGLLDSLTGGAHTTTKAVLDESQQLRDEEEALKVMLEVKPTDEIKVDADSLKSLQSLGIDVSFVDGFEEEIRTMAERHEMQQKLDQMSELLGRLQRTQHGRLSQMPPAHLAQVARPSVDEQQTADNIVEHLGDMVRRVQPADVCSVTGVRKAMNLPGSSPSHHHSTPDLELELSQFLDSDPALQHNSLLQLRPDDDKTIEDILMA